MDANIVYGDHKQHILDVYSSSSPSSARKDPVIISIHGGGWKSGDKGNAAAKGRDKFFIDLGYLFVSPNYRLSGDDGGTSFPQGIYDAVKAIIWVQDHIEKYGGDPSRIVLAGASAGAHMSALLAYNNERDWAGEVGFPGRKLNVIGFFGDSGVYAFDPVLPNAKKTAVAPMLGALYSPDKWRVAEPINFVDAADVPAFLCGGDRDSVVGNDNSPNFYKKLREVGVACDLVIVPGYKHVQAWNEWGSQSNRELETKLAKFLTVLRQKTEKEGPSK